MTLPLSARRGSTSSCLTTCAVLYLHSPPVLRGADAFCFDPKHGGGEQNYILPRVPYTLETPLDWSLVTCLFADDTVMLAEGEEDLQRTVNEFYSVCKRRKFKVNAGKSKVMVFERREEVTDINTAYRVRLPAVVRYSLRLGSEKMEKVCEFKYLGTVLSKHGGMEEEILRASHERQECCGFTRWGNEREE